jgi:putative hemolysin
MNEATPIATSVSSELLELEIASLPASTLLHQHHSLQVYLCHAHLIPQVLREIGIQREITFRAVGEGTGLAIDLDEYDDSYLHLFIWDQQEEKIVGGYRLGVVRQLLDTLGARGLYTSTLFGFSPTLLQQLENGIELGRSFVTPAYQGHPFVLSLLWKGIGSFVARNPQHHLLFGPVSISNDYSHLSRSLMVDFLQREKMHDQWSSLVQPRMPFVSEISQTPDDMLRFCQSVEHVTAAISEAEIDRKGMPILLKHYLKLNARVLSFNVDEKFANALDVLIVTDLREGPEQTIKRYLGADGWQRLQAYAQQENLCCA